MSTLKACDDCGWVYETRFPKLAKRCHLCRLICALRYLKTKYDGFGHTVACAEPDCGRAFAPLEENRHPDNAQSDRLCWQCDPYPSRFGFRSVPGYCEWCETEVPNLLSDGFHVCVKCAKQPDNRRMLWNSAHSLQAERRKETGWPHHEQPTQPEPELLDEPRI